jgi:site-specific recombinase XerD
VLDELERRNYSQATVDAYVSGIRRFAEYFHRSPDQLGCEHVREYQLHLVQERKLHPRTVMIQMAALRFLFLKVLKRRYSRDDLPLPKLLRRQVPTVLSRDEVLRLIDSTANLRHRTILMALYSTGMRRSELCHLRTEDIDKERMVIRIRQGKGGYHAAILRALRCDGTARRVLDIGGAIARAMIAERREGAFRIIQQPCSAMWRFTATRASVHLVRASCADSRSF